MHVDMYIANRRDCNLLAIQDTKYRINIFLVTFNQLVIIMFFIFKLKNKKKNYIYIFFNIFISIKIHLKNYTRIINNNNKLKKTI